MANDESRERVLKARVARERAAAGERRVRFSKWVRQEAVELVTASGTSRDRFAQEMGIGKTSLQRWVRAIHGRKRGQQRATPAFHHVVVASPAPATQVAVVFPSGARLVGLGWEQVLQLLGVSA
jgi:transposase-like protein